MRSLVAALILLCCPPRCGTGSRRPVPRRHGRGRTSVPTRRTTTAAMNCWTRRSPPSTPCWSSGRNLVRVRLELAHAFFLKGEDGLATGALRDGPGRRRARRGQGQRGGLPRPRSAPAGAGASTSAWRWRPTPTSAAGSDERTIIIHGLPFERDADQLTTSGIGLSVWGGAEYQAPVSERLRIRAGAQASRREYAGSGFDQHFAALHLGPRWLVDAATEASFLISARQSWSGAPDYRDLGARLEVARWLGPRVTAFAHASWHDRRYRIPEPPRRSGVGCHPARLLGGPADGAGRPLRRLCAAKAEVPARAPPGPLARHRRHRGPAPGLHGRRQRGDALDRLRAGLVPLRRRQRSARGPHPVLQALRPQPGVHARRVQPGTRGHPREARQQRPAPRLPPHLRENCASSGCSEQTGPGLLPALVARTLNSADASKADREFVETARRTTPAIKYTVIAVKAGILHLDLPDCECLGKIAVDLWSASDGESTSPSLRARYLLEPGPYRA